MVGQFGPYDDLSSINNLVFILQAGLNENITRHIAHTNVSRPSPKQRLMVFDADQSLTASHPISVGISRNEALDQVPAHSHTHL